MSEGAAERPTLQLATSHGVVPALDLDSPEATVRLVEATTSIEGIVGYKLGLTMVLRFGLAEAVRRIRRVTPLPLLYDHQKAGPDVPDMAAKFTALCREAGVDGLILFPLAGPRAVEQFVGRSLENGLVPLVGGALPLADYMVSGGGYIADDALPRIIEASLSLGADHFVVPGDSAARVSRMAAFLAERATNPTLLIPGIGALGGSLPEAFTAAGTARVYAIIGRAIYGASDPAEAARRLAGEALGFA